MISSVIINTHGGECALELPEKWLKYLTNFKTDLFFDMMTNMV